MRYLFILLLSMSCLFAMSDEQYDQLFVELSNEGIIVGQDISTKELYELIENGEVYLKNGKIDKDKLDKKIKEFIKYKEENFAKINKNIESNSQSKTRQEIKEYLNDNNERVEKAQEDFSKGDNDGVFSKVINYFLELMKY